MTEIERLEDLVARANSKIRELKAENSISDLESEFDSIEDADLSQKHKSGSGF